MVPVTDGDRRPKSYQFFSQSGALIGDSERGFEPEDTAPLLPSLPGEAIFEFYAKSTEVAPKSDNDIVLIETPILGWRSSLPRARPVTYRPYLDRGASMYLYRLADGRFCDEWNKGECIGSLAEARAYVLQRIRSLFD
jgi:hypothetical protein